MATESFRQLRQYRNNLSLMEYWGTAPPSASTDKGPFNLGDVYWNEAPAVGTPIGWICTTAGADGSTAVFSPISGSVTPVAAGSTYTVSVLQNNATILLNTATGSVVTLPAATGSGATYFFTVSATVTSNSHKILAASSSDFIIGFLVIATSGAAASGFSSAASTNHSIAMSTTTTGGQLGGWLVLEDIAANTWHAKGNLVSTGTPATAFSSSTS